jgi:hypothetical protein
MKAHAAYQQMITSLPRQEICSSTPFIVASWQKLLDSTRLQTGNSMAIRSGPANCCYVLSLLSVAQPSHPQNGDNDPCP